MMHKDAKPNENLILLTENNLINMKNMKSIVNSATKLALSKRWIIVLMAAVFALPAMAGWNTAGINKDATTTQQTFHSTSTMQGSGSSHSYMPASLNEEGRATYSDPYDTPSYTPRGPRKSFGQNGEGGITSDESSPVGDAVLPLLLFAAAFGGVITFRRRRAAQALNG